MAWKLYFGFALLLALVSAALYGAPLAFIASLFGHVQIDSSKLVHWANGPALNNEECVVNYAANACEDVKIHFGSNTAFLACGNPLERTHWYPPACVHDAASRSEASFREQLFKYDIKTGHTIELRIEGLEGDFVTHGIDLFQSPSDPSKVTNPQSSF